MAEALSGGAWVAWAWLPITVFAALAQTVRNAAQRHLTGELGTLGAMLVRFLYGLPFALAWLAVVAAVGGDPLPLPGAAAWAGWFTAMAMEPVVRVRTVGLVELLFSYLVSHRIFRERLSPTERLGLVLVGLGLVGVVNGR